MRHTIHTILFSVLLGTVFCGSVQAEDYSLRFYDDHSGLSHHHTTRVLQDSTGMMWIATYNGLNRFDGYRFVAFKAEDSDGLSMPTDRIRRIRLTEDNNILCLIEDSIVLFNTKTCRFEALSVQKEHVDTDKMQVHRNPDLWREKEVYSSLGNLRMKNIRQDYEDRQGNHWLIDDHGFFIATPVPQRGTGINNEEVRAIRRLKSGIILASIRGTKQLAVYDSTLHLLGYIQKNGQLSRRPASFDAQVYCICESGDNTHTWIGCKPGGLIEYRPATPDRIQNTDLFTTYPDVRNVYDVVEDKDGNIWAATFGFGLWVKKPSDISGLYSDFSLVPGTEGMRMRRLLVLEDNTLLAATEQGLLVIDRMIKLHQREGGRKSSLSSNAIMCLEFFNGQLYVGTEGGGINRLIGNDIHAERLEFEHITKADGLSSDIVYEFMPWSEDELLVQCNNALSILKVKGERLKVKGESSCDITNYGKSYFRSADDKSFNLGEVPPIDLGDGRILIAPHDGMLVLNKSELTPETEPVRIAFSAITLEGKMNYAVDGLTRLTMAPNERSLGIQFAALDYRSNSDIQYRTRFYTAGEKDAPWSAPTEMSQMLVQDLTPGEYVFEVRSTNALGQWQDNTRRLYITVTPTFWESKAGWTLQIGLLLLITIAITFQSTRIRYHRKQRAATLNAYLELQERYLAISSQTQERSDPEQPQEPLPIPEILVPGYTSENERFLNALHTFMEENIGNAEMNMDDLADRMNMSRSTLNRKMHELFNLSAKDFVQAARIKHACQLLRTTDMAAKEVAYACGFSDPRYFSKSFKANTGQTPTEYRDSSPATS